MDPVGKAYRRTVLNGTTDPAKLPKDLRGPLAALKTKNVGNITHTPDLYTGVVTSVDGRITPITEQEWSNYWKHVTKGKVARDSGITTDMMRLAPPGLLGSYRDIANAALARGCIPDSWKREVICPIEKSEGAVRV